MSSMGLTEVEVAQRVREGKTNTYTEKTSRSAADILRANVLTIFNAILGAALIVVLVVGSPADALFGFVLVLNTLTGTVAEIRAKRALDRLAVLEQPVAHVIRDGQPQDIEVGAVVLDDVLTLRTGEQVPADGTILQVDGLEVDESILTGESAPVRPRAQDRVLSGTTVTAGSATIRATAVGAQAYAHRLAREARRYSVVSSELQEGTNRVLRWISWVIVPVAALLIWSQVRQAGGWAVAVDTGQWRRVLVAGIAGVVGMVPQGLVLLTSVNFATASLRLARRHVLVQELPAVEVLARVDTLCLDKTGTLTTGGIQLHSLRGADNDLLWEASSQPQDQTGSPRVTAEMDTALQALCAGENPNATALAIRQGRGYKAQAPSSCTATVPFSSRRKWSAAQIDGNSWVMGAPEIVLNAAHGGSDLLSQVSDLASDGMRVVAVAASQRPLTQSEGAEAQLPAGLRAQGLVLLSEQVRPDAPQTLGYFREQGVDVKVISGDNPDTVAAVAAQAGVSAPGGAPLTALDARELPTQITSEDDRHTLATALETAQVLGRVTPEQKRAFVQALKAHKHTVAMTGDGVNDALALKEADLGIAMGNGAPATKAVARLVLLSGEFSALPGVVAEGRRVMANTERIASLFLSKTVYASLIAVLVAVTTIAYPFLPRQLTIVSSLTIGVPAFILALAPNKRRYQAGFLPRVLSLAVPAGLVAGSCTLIAHTWLVASGLSETQVTTGSTLVLAACGLALLTLTARPLLGWRLGLILLMGILVVLGVLIPGVRHFFLLDWPTATTWGVIGVVTLCALGGMWLVEVLRSRLAARLGAVSDPVSELD